MRGVAAAVRIAPATVTPWATSLSRGHVFTRQGGKAEALRSSDGLPRGAICSLQTQIFPISSRCRYLSHFRSIHRGAYFAEIRTTTGERAWTWLGRWKKLPDERVWTWLGPCQKLPDERARLVSRQRFGGRFSSPQFSSLSSCGFHFSTISPPPFPQCASCSRSHGASCAPCTRRMERRVASSCISRPRAASIAWGPL